MKALFTLGVLAFSFQGFGQGVSTPPLQAAAQPVAGVYSIKENGANSRVWEKVDYENQNGRQVPRVHRFTELATGLNHLKNGQWVESKEEIDILPDGTAAAVEGQHQVYFPANIYNGVIDVVTPGRKHLKSRPIGLSYWDGQKSILIAELKSSVGTLVSSNQIIYPDAFTDFKADLRYTYTKGHFEQDVILREQPTSPETYGFDPEATTLEVLTEFFDSPAPVRKMTANRAVPDEELDFGTMKMKRGRAFALGDTNGISQPVGKSWATQNGRNFLIEGVKLQGMRKELNKLPSATINMSSLSTLMQSHHVVQGHSFPSQPIAKRQNATSKLAKGNSPAKSGYVLDYTLLTSAPFDYTFQGDTTYYISDGVFVDTATFEGGTVLKQSGGGNLYVNTIISQTGPYRPAIFTSVNDDTVGEVISGISTGNPERNDWDQLETDNPPRYARFLYATQALYAHQESEFRDLQFINCATAINDTSDAAEDGDGMVVLRNVLFSNCGYAVIQDGGASLWVQGENITVDACDHFAPNSPSGGITNSILTAVGDGTNGIVFLNTFVTNDGSAIYQTVGGGNYYLAANSPYRNAGTTNIDSGLLAELKKRTTYPPILLYQPAVYLLTNLNLNPQIQRDTDIPDLGYHYDPLDYLLGSIYVTNLSVTINAGTAIGIYATNKGVGALGLDMYTGGHFSSVGTPINLCEIATYNTVQEKSVPTWIRPAFGLVSSFAGAGSSYCANFTEYSVLAQDSPLIEGAGNSTPAFNLENCQFHGGKIITTGPTINFTNCLFERVNVDFEPADANIPVLRNNLFWYGTFYFDTGEGAIPCTNTLVKDNAFIDTVIDDNSSDYFTYNGGHNAFVSGQARLLPTDASDVILSDTPAYQSGPLGNYYEPPLIGRSTDPLINGGSTTADLVGLYHFTTQTNEVKETNSVVDIGYHYVAVDGNGKPIDTDGDGLPDYLEDSNGNGSVDVTDFGNWLVSSFNGLSFTKQLLIFTPLK